MLYISYNRIIYSFIPSTDIYCIPSTILGAGNTTISKAKVSIRVCILVWETKVGEPMSKQTTVCQMVTGDGKQLE
jgi:hypothetical protein